LGGYGLFESRALQVGYANAQRVGIRPRTISSVRGEAKGMSVVDIPYSIVTTFEINLQAFKKVDSFGSFLLKKRTPSQFREEPH